MIRLVALLLLVIGVCDGVGASQQNDPSLFSANRFEQQDSILVVDDQGQTLFDWRADRARTPASVMKLLTAWLAINKWGVSHRFTTSFYWHNNSLWVQGTGDPMLIAEELDTLVAKLKPMLPTELSSINLDSSLFSDLSVPGRGATDDPYNAPLSALAINFNTISLKKVNGQIASGEPQTPLTPTARNLAASTQLGKRTKRINVGNADVAQRQFGEVLKFKLDVSVPIRINQSLPEDAKLLYQHANSHSLEKILRGALEYSNNFIANQLFIMLAQSATLNFETARSAVDQMIKGSFAWSTRQVYDGAGLSRDNQLSAHQVVDVLDALEPYQQLLKRYALKTRGAEPAYAFAKSGTLSDVHSLAGYLHVGDQQYKFVFMFNRPMPYQYREVLLQTLADQLSAGLKG